MSEVLHCRSVYRFDDGGSVHWYVAETEAEALAAMLEDWREPGVHEPPPRVTRLDDDTMLTIHDDGGPPETKTAIEWATERPCCMLGSTEY